jgi:hypothetical protein
MEEILYQIVKYQRLGTFCALGAVLCLGISICMYRKKKLRKTLECLWRNRKKKILWMLLIFMACISTGMESYGVEEDGESEEIVEDLISPVLEVTYTDEEGNNFDFSEEGNQLFPYYYTGEKIVMDGIVEEVFLDLEQSYIKITRSDKSGTILEEKEIELQNHRFQTEFTLDGHYQVHISMIDQTGNVSIHEMRFAMDREPPMEPVIRYVTEEGVLNRFFNQNTFGWFAKNKITAYILVDDLVSDISKVTYSYQEDDAEKMVTETATEIEGEVKVELPFSFKGKMTVQSEDCLGHISEIYEDIGVIAESEETHEEYSEAQIKVLTQYSKTEGYYNQDVQLEFKTQDTYSGIKEIDYFAGVGFSETKSFEDKTEICTEEIIREYTLLSVENEGNYITTGVSFVDNAGHKKSVPKNELPEIHIDITQPKIKVFYDNNDAVNEKYYKDARTATILVEEKNFDTKDVDFEIYGPDVSITEWSQEGDEWKCKVEFHKDGEYQFGFSCTDLAGNRGKYQKIDEFVIDQTNPVISVSYDNMDAEHEMYYKAPRRAMITIEEKNFDAKDVEIRLTAQNQGKDIPTPEVLGWSSEEEANRATIAYDYEGVFTFDIAYEDLAGNAANLYLGDHFCIDLTNPKIIISGVRHQSANQGEVSPVITITDSYYTEETVWWELYASKKGKLEVVPEKAKIPEGVMIKIPNYTRTQENDDLYCLSAGVRDLAGNQAEVELWYSLNRFGSVYTLDPDTKQLAGYGGDYYTTKGKQLVVTETNVDDLIFHEIVCNWNGNLRTLVKDKDYTVTESGNSYSWKQYRYVIHADNFEKEGHYIVTLCSKDRANNLSDNQSKKKTISFAVDASAPDVVFSGIEQGGRYRMNEKEILIDIQDNLALKEVEILLDDQKMTYDKKMLQDLEGKILVTAKGKNDWQSIQLTAKDMAGNLHTPAKIDFLVTPNLLIQIWNHKPSFYSCIGCVTTLLIIVGLLLRKNYKR